MNRKLIRPNLTEYKDKMSRDSSKKKAHPAYETHAENYYYLKQMNKKTPMAIVFQDGESVEGYVEWYDKECLKLNRDKAPNLLIYKSGIKYLYKLESARRTRSPKGSQTTPQKKKA
jgi:sRNA-binding regulator protein Hfq